MPLLAFLRRSRGRGRHGVDSQPSTSSLPLYPHELIPCVAATRAFLDAAHRLLPAAALAPMDSNTAGRVISAIIIAIRLSLPLPECPGWDDAWARSQLRIDEWLEHFPRLHDGDLTTTTAKTKRDSASAMRAVMQVVRETYKRKLAAAERLLQQQSRDMQQLLSDQVMVTCPMLDGSMQQHFPDWAADLAPGDINVSMDATGPAPRVPVYHDLWATMTMGWAAQTMDSETPSEFTS
jgi:hypothetical protein